MIYLSYYHIVTKKLILCLMAEKDIVMNNCLESSSAII